MNKKEMKYLIVSPDMNQDELSSIRSSIEKDWNFVLTNYVVVFEKLDKTMIKLTLIKSVSLPSLKLYLTKPWKCKIGLHCWHYKGFEGIEGFYHHYYKCCTCGKDRVLRSRS